MSDAVAPVALTAQLAAPFAASDVEWRIARSGVKDSAPWAMCLAYITNRAIMDRLDATVGAMNWRNEFQPWPQGTACGLSLRLNGEWITKWDGAEKVMMVEGSGEEKVEFESVKGGFSAAMKRAAVQWGIGRYLYDLEEGWAVIGDKGPYRVRIQGTWYKWSPPALPAWALPQDGRPIKEVVKAAFRDAPDFTKKPEVLTRPEEPAPFDRPAHVTPDGEIHSPSGSTTNLVRPPVRANMAKWPLPRKDGKQDVYLADMTQEDLQLGKAWARKRGGHDALIEAIDLELDRRRT